MKKAAALAMVFWVWLMPGCRGKDVYTTFGKSNLDDYAVTMKRDFLCLMMAYPEHIEGIEVGKGGVYLVMKSGSRILYDDGNNKSFEQKLKNPDLQDMLEQLYPLGGNTALMALGFEPGRIRHYELLKEVYGSSRAQVESNLVRVETTYIRCAFNDSNNAASSLQNAAAELERLCRDNSKIRSYIFPINGTYNYRTVAGTSRLSSHAFGIAIDFVVDKRDYWRWATRQQGEERLLKYPPEIVEAMEKNNFIWGGKWGHFDIMHFEYRPEIVLKSKFSQNNTGGWEPWYEGFPAEDQKVKEYIDGIEEELANFTRPNM